MLFQPSLKLLHSLAPSLSYSLLLAPSLCLSLFLSLLYAWQRSPGIGLFVLHLHGHILTGLMIGSRLDCFLITCNHTHLGYLLQSCSAHHLF